MPPRPVWTGSIMFGLVNVPVKLFSIEQKADLNFNLLDARDQARVRYARVNEETGEEVPWDQIVKGYEYQEGSYVLLSDEDFEQAGVEATKTIEVQSFVNLDDIPYYYFEKPYIITPGKRGEKPYVLLREALKETRRVGVAKVVIRSRQYLAALVAEGDALLLELLRYHQEIRPMGDFDLPDKEVKSYGVTTKELDFAEKLVSALADNWKPEQYTDEYRASLLEWIEKKVKTGETGPTPEEEEKPEEKAEPADLMSLLQKSLRQAR